MNNKELAIVIPAADLKKESGQFLDDLLASIVEGQTHNHTEIIVCFDGCKPRFVHTFCEKYPFIIPLVYGGDRLNFAKNSNRGLRVAHNEMKLPVLLVNQDTILPKWEYLKLIPGRGLVTPYTTLDMVTATNTGKRVTIQSRFPFFCPYWSTELMKEIGFLDGAYVASFEDDDAIGRTLLAGFPIEQVDVGIFHKGSHVDQAQIGGSLSGAYDGNRLTISHERYRLKWNIPREIPHEECVNWILKHHRWNKELMFEA